MAEAGTSFSIVVIGEAAHPNVDHFGCVLPYLFSAAAESDSSFPSGCGSLCDLFKSSIIATDQIPFLRYDRSTRCQAWREDLLSDLRQKLLFFSYTRRMVSNLIAELFIIDACGSNLSHPVQKPLISFMLMFCVKGLVSLLHRVPHQIGV